MYFSYFHFSNWKIFFFWSFVIIQLNEVIRRIFYFSSRWLLFYIPTIRICLWASSNDFLVKFWKVTVLQVNWLVSQECSWELSNLLYLYPSKISNLRRGEGFFFNSPLSSQREELNMNVSKHLAEAALALCEMYSIFSWWNLTSSPSLFLGGIGWSLGQL